MSDKAIRDTLRAKYGEAALRALDSPHDGCPCDPVTSNLYDAAETAALPEGAVLASVGCGNPTALAEVHEGAVVPGLGSGCRVNVPLTARRVGASREAYGPAMTAGLVPLFR